MTARPMCPKCNSVSIRMIQVYGHFPIHKHWTNVAIGWYCKTCNYIVADMLGDIAYRIMKKTYKIRYNYSYSS